MQQAENNSETLAVDLARECLYRFLALALSDPRVPGWEMLLNIDNQGLAREAADLLRFEANAEPIVLGFGELAVEHLDVRPLMEYLDSEKEELRAEYDRVFGLVFSRECPPYETEYHASAEPFFRSQELADIAGFYRAYGLETAHSLPERPDHISLELEFLAFVLMKKRLAVTADNDDPQSAEQARICKDTERSFFRDHLAWWVPSFATGLRRKAGSGFYAALAGVLAALLPLERARLGVDAPRLPLQPALIERPEEQAGCVGCSN